MSRCDRYASWYKYQRMRHISGFHAHLQDLFWYHQSARWSLVNMDFGCIARWTRSAPLPLAHAPWASAETQGASGLVNVSLELDSGSILGFWLRKFISGGSWVKKGRVLLAAFRSWLLTMKVWTDRRGIYVEPLARTPGSCITELKDTQLIRRNVEYDVHQSGGLLAPSPKIPVKKQR